ncbi:MAG: VanZ family protein [Chitinophagaceae bacterium]
MKKLFGSIYIPLAWTILIEILFCLPGSTIPDTGSMFTIPNLDKIVHIIIFGTFVGLWCFYFSKKSFTNQKLKLVFFYVFLIAAFNGIAIEFIQKYFIPNRSFDQGDIIADLLSAGIAYGICNVKLLV